MSHHPRQSLHPAAMNSNAAMPMQQQSVTNQIMQLDQAITLSLQEIDQNFATAHQIVTSRILPAVKEYGVASARVWQGARFWKTFFEVSAGVSLSAQDNLESDYASSSYREDTSRGAESEQNRTFTSDSAGQSPRSDAGSIVYTDLDTSQTSDDQRDDADNAGDESVVPNLPTDRAHPASPPKFSNASMAAAARREAAQQKQLPPSDRTREKQENANNVAESPFERLRKDITSDLGRGQLDSSVDQASFLAQSRAKAATGQKAGNGVDQDRAALAQDIENLDLMRSRGAQAADPDDSNASFAQDLPQYQSNAVAGSRIKTSSTPKKGPLLQKVLNSEHTKTKGRLSYTKINATPRDSNSESNPFAPPSVRMWDGIVDLRKTPLVVKMNKGKAGASQSSAKKPKSSKKSQSLRNAAKEDPDWDSDSDADSLGWPAGMSPPVTMQFSVPQSRYAQTPAKEAARMMVDDLLRSVGAASPAARAWPKSSVKKASSRPPQANSSSRPQPAGTPLRLSRKEAKQLTKSSGQDDGGHRRDSMPTPPTLTKRGLSSVTEGTPDASNVGARSSEAGLANISSAAMLMDDGEGLELGAGDRHRAGLQIASSDVEDNDTPARMSSLAAKAQLPVEDEDDDEESSESEEEEEEEDDAIAASMLSSAAKFSVSSNSRLGGSSHQDNSGWTSSTVSSFSQPKQAGRSIEDDTLFGVRNNAPPRAAENAGRAAAPTSSRPVASTASSASTRTGAGEVKPSNDSFKVWGHVDEMGTVHGGRPLVDRDDTYSAPSPTPFPATFSSAASRK